MTMPATIDFNRCFHEYVPLRKLAEIAALLNEVTT